jgi:predicted RNA-binding Zn ribbon-like protein
MGQGPSRWLADDEPKPAPAPLSRVQELVNTVERPDGADRLAAVDDARPWLIDQHLLGADADLDESDLALARDVREALRALLVHNSGGPAPSSAALAPLRRIAKAGAVRADLHTAGDVRLAAVGESLAQRLVEVLLVMRDAQRDGSWARLKACANDECQWAFYDRSRNHGGTWCEMAACGNKLKNRNFRARRRQAANG